jgi:poly(3-hydroxybutyrate) depolymerase
VNFVKDFVAGLLLRLLVILLSPGLLFAGRSLRAKAIGLRALAVVAVAVAALVAGAALGLGWLPGRGSGLAIVWAVGLALFVVAPLVIAIYFSRSRLEVTVLDSLGGNGTWASFNTGYSFGFAEATVAVENDFVGFTAEVLTRLDPRLWGGRGRVIRATVADDLEAMAERHELERLPSALSWDLRWSLLTAWLRFRRPDREHAFVYVPPHTTAELPPLVVVCHGHGGNPFLGCVVWERLADDLGFVAAFPTFGYGNGEHDHAATAIVNCRKAVAARFGVDGSRAVLVGVSQGGCGVTRGATATRWAGLVYVSATMERRLLGPDSVFAEVWRGRPVLVAHGLKDANVRPATVTAAVAAMRQAGVAVTHVTEPDADHFYLFEKRVDFAEAFRGWWATLPGLGGGQADVVAEQPAAE